MSTHTPNILFSSTRQWNPGDEFILMGLINLMKSVCDFNPVIFNRNPEIQRPRSRFCFSLSFDPLKARVKRLKPGTYDNSFKDSFLSQEPFIDLAVFAGTPEWASPRLRSMYEYIDRFSIPVIYAGIGTGNPSFRLSHLSPLYRRVLKRARLIAVRDRFCRDILASMRPVLLPCPSLLAALPEYERRIRKVSTIGLIYSTPKSVRYNRIDAQTFAFQRELYRMLLSSYGRGRTVEFICHYVDELPQVRRDFPEWKCNYSYDAADYLSIYNKFDLVIGTRVHGMGIAASMGIPGVHIVHDIRSSSCDEFFAGGVVPADGVDKAFSFIEERMDSVPAVNARLLRHKEETRRRYYELLLKVLVPGSAGETETNSLEPRPHS